MSIKSEQPKSSVAPRFAPVKTKRGFQEVADQIRSEISAGRLAPGDRLPSERDMAVQFGVSRQAVREALRGLEMAGMVASKVGVAGGAFVESGDLDVVARGLEDLSSLGRFSNGSLLEARIIMTTTALGLACERGSEEDFDRLDADTDQIEELRIQKRFEERSKRVVDFYRILGVATHNDVFALLLNSLTQLVQRRLSAVGHAPRKDLAKVRHEIVARLRESDAAGAVEIMVAHLQRLEASLSKEEHRAK
jgi:DNA-binding FadR family transcriptional regulator